MANAQFGQREDLYRITVKVTGVDGKTWSAQFDTFDGGDMTSTETKYRPGNGTKDQLSLGGARTINNINVGALMTYEMYQKITWLFGQVGKGEMQVHKQPLDVNGAAYGKPLVYKGKLMTVNPPKTDASSDAAGILVLTQSSVTPVAMG